MDGRIFEQAVAIRPSIREDGLIVRPSDLLHGSYTPGVRALRVVNRGALLRYLNDHLAALVAAIKLLKRVSAAQEDSHLGITLAEFVRVLEREQQIVQRIVDAFDGGLSVVKATMARLSEMASRLTIGGFSTVDGNLDLFQALELLSIGFYGRMSLWQTLDRLNHSAVLGLNLDFQNLIRGVEAQLDTLRLLRRDTATFALSTAVDEC